MYLFFVFSHVNLAAAPRPEAQLTPFRFCSAGTRVANFMPPVAFQLISNALVRIRCKLADCNGGCTTKSGLKLRTPHRGDSKSLHDSLHNLNIAFHFERREGAFSTG